MSAYRSTEPEEQARTSTIRRTRSTSTADLSLGK